VDESDNVYPLEDDCSVRRFSIDPQITDLSTLQSIIVRAFNLKRLVLYLSDAAFIARLAWMHLFTWKKFTYLMFARCSDFNLSFYRRDVNSFVPLQTDWDLDSAFLNSSHPFLRINMSVDKQNSLPDWDIITVADVTKAAQMAASQTHQIANTFLTRVRSTDHCPVNFPVAVSGDAHRSQMEKMVAKAFTNSNRSTTNNEQSNNCPLTERQYYNYLDNEGRISSMRELRISVFRRGVEPSLRKAVWKHLLNVYPPGLVGQQRIDYIKAKSEQYSKLREIWRSHQMDPKVECVYNMVKKDVLRTDRSHAYFYGTGEDNKNVTSLLNILTTFALNHKVKYCQGMSDLASPLLYAMKDEAHGYICFCALMRRMEENFRSDGEVMSRKFELLSQLLQYYDQEFYCYLKQNKAHELLFCYRWIFLELKREFAFDDAMLMLEVLWSSIPPTTLEDLPLVDEEFRFIPGQYKNYSTLRGTFDSLSINGSSLETTYSHSHEEDHTNGKVYSNHNYCNNETGEQSILDYDLENSVKLRNLEQLLNSSSGHGSLTSTVSLDKPSKTVVEKNQKANVAQRPLRTIRFLPKILSNDSKEIDSPEADDYNKQYYFPPKFIDKQFSVDDEEKPRVKSFESMGSVDSCDSATPEPENNRLEPKTRAQLFRQRCEKEDNNSMDVEEFIVHCNGEYVDKMISSSAVDWQVPRGLARSESLNSLKDANGDGSDCTLDAHECSEECASASVTENEYGFNGKHSNSASSLSLEILSSTGSVVDGICSSKLRKTLPTPSELGSNNAFMLFLSLTLLLQHRDTIVSKKMDANEIAMYYDGLVRKHNVHSVLEMGRHLFHSYLSQWHRNSVEDESNGFTKSSFNGNSNKIETRTEEG
ncbi:uncharacterized protein B4U80_00642, partial [Leptotrombidium deliense]